MSNKDIVHQGHGRRVAKIKLLCAALILCVVVSVCLSPRFWWAVLIKTFTLGENAWGASVITVAFISFYTWISTKIQRSKEVEVVNLPSPKMFWSQLRAIARNARFPILFALAFWFAVAVFFVIPNMYEQKIATPSDGPDFKGVITHVVGHQMAIDQATQSLNNPSRIGPLKTPDTNSWYVTVRLEVSNRGGPSIIQNWGLRMEFQDAQRINALTMVGGRNVTMMNSNSQPQYVAGESDVITQTTQLQPVIKGAKAVGTAAFLMPFKTKEPFLRKNIRFIVSFNDINDRLYEIEKLVPSLTDF